MTAPTTPRTPTSGRGLSEAVEAACKVMHNAYETAAVGAGWETQQASRKPWTDVPEANKATMRVAVAALIDHLCLAAVVAERDTAVAKVAAVEALADEWADQVRRGHAENPGGHAALSTHERDLEELRAALAAPVDADLTDRRQLGDGTNPGNNTNPATCPHQHIDRSRTLTSPPRVITDWCRDCHTYWTGGSTRLTRTAQLP